MIRPLLCIILLIGVVGVASADSVILWDNYDAHISENTDQAYDTLFRDVGDAIDATSTSLRLGYTTSTTSPGVYSSHYRSVISFGSNASFPAGSTVTAAVISVYSSSRSNTMGDVNLSTIDYTGANPAVTGDYDSTTFTRQATDIPYATVTGWFTITLTNLTRINPTGNTTYMFDHNRSVDLVDLSWVSGSNSYLAIRPIDYSSGTYAPYITITYTPAAGGDTTPPESISNIANTTTCNSINWTFTNPGGDQNETMVYKDGVFLHNLTNTTSYDLWTGLSGWNSYEFESRTVDIAGNVNATWTNQTARASIICKLLNYIRLQNSCYQLVNT